ncbi:MAG: hypothetical protein L0211_21375 [Planctomycetaceae bacterium]|nr:hypothetical protein [Planctomycetaceae bacterium]
MFWAQRMTQWLVSDRLAEMTERVAGRSRMAVWQRVADQLAGLGPSEARGYVRARAIAVVQIETGRLIEQEGLRVGKMREKIITAATESLVERIVSQIQQRRSALRHVA